MESEIVLDSAVIHRLKVAYYERWNPEQHGFMVLQIPSMNVCFSNDLDCNGNIYFGYKSFLKTIEKWA